MSSRKYVHRHNALLGHIVSIQKRLLMLQHSPSITPEGRDFIMEAAKQMQALQVEVRRFRVEEDGTKKEISNWLEKVK